MKPRGAASAAKSPFVKYHGLGNDFVVIDARQHGIFLSKDEAAALCDRHRGIGADGILWLLKGKTAPYRMHIHNSDGSEPGMCGNGVRVFAHYLLDHSLGGLKMPIPVETPSGKVVVNLLEKQGDQVMVEVDMGRPRLAAKQIPVKWEGSPVLDLPVKVGAKTWSFHCVNMGNPHAVTFVPKITDAMVLKTGPVVETHPLFPQKTNVEFAKVEGPKDIRMRVWERGVGETQACGTGACATGVAAMLNGLTSDKVTVHLLGGPLVIDWTGRKEVRMTGPSQRVFQGKLG